YQRIEVENRPPGKSLQNPGRDGIGNELPGVNATEANHLGQAQLMPGNPAGVNDRDRRQTGCLTDADQKTQPEHEEQGISTQRRQQSKQRPATAGESQERLGAPGVGQESAGNHEERIAADKG